MHGDTKSTAKLLGVAPKTLENWRSKGIGPVFIKLGGKVVYAEQDVDAWLATRRRTSTAQAGSGQSTAAA